jgi:hypothetical protein
MAASTWPPRADVATAAGGRRHWKPTCELAGRRGTAGRRGCTGPGSCCGPARVAVVDRGEGEKWWCGWTVRCGLGWVGTVPVWFGCQVTWGRETARQNWLTDMDENTNHIKRFFMHA